MCFPVLATYIATEIRREQPLVCVGSNVDQRSVRLDKNFIWYISLYLQLVYSEVTAWRRVGEMVKAGEKWKRRVKATNAPSFQPPWASFPSALKSREALHPPLIPSGSLSTPQVADARRSAFSTSQSWPRRVPPASHLLFFSFLSTLRPLSFPLFLLVVLLPRENASWKNISRFTKPKNVRFHHRHRWIFAFPSAIDE